MEWFFLLLIAGVVLLVVLLVRRNRRSAGVDWYGADHETSTSDIAGNPSLPREVGERIKHG